MAGRDVSIPAPPVPSGRRGGTGPDRSRLARSRIGRCQQPGEAGLAHAERQLADVLAFADQEIEGVKPDLVVILSRVQAVEIRNAVVAEQHGLAVDHERTARPRRLAETGRSMAVAGPQPHAIALALDDQAVAVVLDLVKPVRAGGDFRSALGMQGSKGCMAGR